MRHERGFSFTALLMLAVLAAVIGGVGYTLWQRHQVGLSSVVSYDECLHATGSRLLELSPARCVTRDGKQFVQNAGSGSNKAAYLGITEWGVILPLRGDIGDAYYTFDSQTGYVYLSTKTLDAQLTQVNGCKSGLRGLTIMRTQAQGSNSGEYDAQLAGYSYTEVHVAEPLCPVQGGGSAGGAIKTITGLQADLRAAVRGMRSST